MKLHKSFKAAWLEALESGRYRQTSGYLRDEKGFCCLGVACDILGVGEWAEGEEDGVFTYIYENEEGDGLPPASTYTLMTDVAFERTSAMCSTLSTLNDDGSTFAEIAEYIRENL